MSPGATDPLARVVDTFMLLLLRIEDDAFKPERNFLVLRMDCGCGANRRMAFPDVFFG